MLLSNAEKVGVRIAARMAMKRERHGGRRSDPSTANAEHSQDEGREGTPAEERGPSACPEGQDVKANVRRNRRSARQAALFQTPSRGEDDFCPGNILAIRLRNFMTFDSLTVKPSPRLNLIVGPNGSGKSSVVCAIGIGLAGEPRLLGRASDVADFIQRGKESAAVRIVLRGTNVTDTVAVERRISSSNRSEWLINGRATRREDVKQLMERLNIQVENLTQFLPQERVCEFAGLSRERLLEETLKAVGDPELAEQHKFLTTARSDILMLDSACKLLSSTVERLRKDNEAVERDVERLNLRKALLEEAERMRKKVPWLKYDKLAKECQVLKVQMKPLNRERNRLHAASLAARQPAEAAKRLKGSLLQRLKANADKVKKLDSLGMEAGKEAASLVQGVRALEGNLEELRKRTQTRESQLVRVREELQRLQQEHQTVPAPEHPREQLEPISAQEKDVRRQLFDKEAEKRELGRSVADAATREERLSSRLRFVQNARNRRIQRARDRLLEEACAWLDANRASLRGTVYGPILAEVDIPNPAHYGPLEHYVAPWVWKAFVTTNVHDRDTLNSAMLQWRTTIINEDGHEDHFRASDGGGVTEKLRRLGVTHRLDEVFAAAPVVRHTLIRQANLQHAFIGGSAADARADEIGREGVTSLFTKETLYTWRGSKYHSGKSLSIENMRQPRLFAQEGSLQEEEALVGEVAEVQGQLEMLRQRQQVVSGEVRALEEEAAELARRRDDIVRVFKRKQKEVADRAARLERKEQEVAELERPLDVEAQEQTIRGKIRAAHERALASAKRSHRALLDKVRCRIEMAPLQLAYSECCTKAAELEREFKAAEEEALNAQQALQQHERALRGAEERAQAAKLDAQAVIDRDADEEVRTAFRQYPDDLEELEEAVREKVAEANRVLCTNEHILEEYERRQKKIEAETEKLEGEQRRLQEAQEKLDRAKSEWVPRLRELVGKINTTFARNFQEMAIAGEVLLDEHGDDFKAYGIRIRVKFRETAELQDLSAQHQSGGERSVSTILYLVALQELSYCPFRVVDEINQGMDAINERKMFQQLVRATCQANTPQCFLVTPKLLPDLDYGSQCSVHTVMNGPHQKLSCTQGFSEGQPLADSVIAVSQTIIS